MLGLMMDRPLLISGLIEHAARFHGTTEIVAVEPDRSRHRTDWRATDRRARRLAQVLARLGVAQGECVASIAWNSHRHLELYYGVSGSGVVLHTVNPRLFPAQIIYMLNHADDRVLFVDQTFLPLVEKLVPHLTTIRHYVYLGEGVPDIAIPNLVSYETLLAAEDGAYDWPSFDERTASMLCYTSGTTGNPKGALYSHRSTVLHALASTSADLLGMTAADTICPIVPMFHVGAWGIPFSAAMTGTRMVLPGQYLDGDSVCALFREEEVTCSAGVPTVWLWALDHVARTGLDFGKLRKVLVGGSALPAAMIDAFARYGVAAYQGWGMTEMSPLGTVATLKAKHLKGDEALRRSALLSQGKPPYLVDLRLVDEDGNELPHDGKSIGELHVRGAWIVSAYFADEAATATQFCPDGWFRTGDLGTIDEDGYLRLTDRAKDVIKSGGEWISSIDLENAAIGHPDVAEAAVIGVHHPKWAERPLMIVALKPDHALDKESLMAHLAARVAKWWLPDDIVTVPELPHSANGKLLKTKLREEFRDYRLPTA